MIRIYNDYYNLIYLKANEAIDNHIKIKSNTQKSGEKNMKDNIIGIYKNIKSKGFIFHMKI